MLKFVMFKVIFCKKNCGNEKVANSPDFLIFSMKNFENIFQKTLEKVKNLIENIQKIINTEFL